MAASLLKHEVINFEGNQDLEIKLLFDDPLKVSANSKENEKLSKDQIIVNLKRAEIFKDPIAQKTVANNLLSDVAIDVPKQVPTELEGVMEAAATSLKTLSTSAGGLLLLNLFLGAGLSKIWKAINILQFIVYTGDWNLSPPANLEVFFY